MKQIGFDIGARKIRLVTPDSAKSATFPAAAAIMKGGSEIVAYCDEALRAASRMPGSVEIVYPFENAFSVTADLLAGFLNYILNHAASKRVKASIVAIAMSGDQTKENEQLCYDACSLIGAREVFMVDPTLAALYGSEISEDGDVMIVNAGASVCDTAIYSNGELLSFRSIPTAGIAFDKIISKYVSKKYCLGISDTTAEEIKLNIASFSLADGDKTCRAVGVRRSLGVPREFTLTSAELQPAVASVFAEITKEIADVISTNGISPSKIVLTGGTSAFRGIDRALEEVLGIECVASSEGDRCVSNGLAKIISGNLFK